METRIALESRSPLPVTTRNGWPFNLPLHNLFIDEVRNVAKVVRLGDSIIVRTAWKFCPDLHWSSAHLVELFHVRWTRFEV
jgi:hypothetical protein